MKMKSKLFGNGAKLALAVLAVCGTLLQAAMRKQKLMKQQSQPLQSIILPVLLLTQQQVRY